MIQNALGKGGFAKVYKAQERSYVNHIVQTVALKVIPKTRVSRPDQLQKVKREIELQSKCHHPNIVQMFSNWESKSCVAVSSNQISPRGEIDQLVGQFIRVKLSLNPFVFRWC